MNELTWEQEQDINAYLTWQAENDWQSKGATLMPITMVRETTVYTLEELEALGWRAHEKAIDNVLQWLWEGFESEFITEDMATVIEMDFTLFECNRRSYRTMSGKTGYTPEIEWSTNPNWVRAKGSVNVARFMRERKLRNKYRLLWEGIKAYFSSISPDASVGFGHGRDGECDLSDLLSDLKYSDWYKGERLARLEQQIAALAGEIDSYAGEIESRLLSNLRAEMDYRESEEFAKEEAEAHEFVFTEEGDIYHG